MQYVVRKECDVFITTIIMVIILITLIIVLITTFLIISIILWASVFAERLN